MHVHSPIASALAAARKPLPVILDVCAFNFRGQVEVAEYGMSGSVELAENVVKALGQRNAVLMANHGSLAVGKNVDVALDRCELLEKASHAYLLSQLVRGRSLEPGDHRQPPERSGQDVRPAARAWRGQEGMKVVAVLDGTPTAAR